MSSGNTSSTNNNSKCRIDPFDPRYANVPLDIPITHVEDYVTRTNCKNDQDHLHSQIMHFKKEFGAFTSTKPTKKSTSTKSSSSTQTQTTTTNSTNNNNSDDHKDQNHTTNNNGNDNDIVLPNINSIESMRSAMARFEAWHYQRHSQLVDDLREFETENASSFALFQNNESNHNHNDNHNEYVTPFYNPFLRIHTNDDSKSNNDHNDDDNKQDLDVNMTNNNNQQNNAISHRMRRLFPRSHYAQNRNYGASQSQTQTQTEQNNNNNSRVRDTRRASRERILQRYRYFNRYRNAIRAMHYYNIRNRLRARQQAHQQNDGNDNIDNNDQQNGDNEYENLPNFLFLSPYFDQLQNENDQRVSQIVDELNLDISAIFNDDDQLRNNANNALSNNVNLSHLISPKLKHVTPSRLDGLSDFKAAFALIPLRLTCKNPFKQTIYGMNNVKKSSKREMDEEDEKEINDAVICGIDNRQNLLSQLSADLHLIILNMLTGLGNMRTIAIYKSLRSELSGFDIERVKHCSVYKCQALFVERYRQNLFDEKYKALQQPALERALSDEPRNLFEFQQDRKKMVMRRQSSSESMHSDFDERMVTV